MEDLEATLQLRAPLGAADYVSSHLLGIDASDAGVRMFHSDKRCIVLTDSNTGSFAPLDAAGRLALCDLR